MDKDFFVKELGALAPSKADFVSYNVPESFITENISRYYCQAKTSISLNFLLNDEVLKLIQTYDCSSVGIGNLSFLKEVIEHENYFEVGKLEIDILVLNKITLKMEIRDHGSPHHIIWSCASNGDRFLDALIICATFLRSLINSSSEPEESYVLGIVNQCTESAGGDEYIDFYKMLLGYFG